MSELSASLARRLTTLFTLAGLAAGMVGARSSNSPSHPPHPATSPPTAFTDFHSGPAPGAAQTRITKRSLTLENRVVSLSWDYSQGGLRPRSTVDRLAGRTLPLQRESFEVILTDGTRWSASQWLVQGQPRVIRWKPQPQASRLAARFAGRIVELDLQTPDGRLQAVWRAILHDQAHYVRQELDLSARKDGCGIREVRWFDGMLPNAQTVGRVDGVPLVAGDFFLGIEDPHALNTSGAEGTDGRVVCRLRREAPLGMGETLPSSFVLGVAPAGQMRRAFLHYVERERAHPYRPFLHYNSWYDIAWSPFHLNETNCLEAIRLFGERFIRPYGVVVDAMVFDDGWDDPKTLWKFHPGFPAGFAPLAEACRSYGTRLGVWLSPFGGYGEPKNQRLRFGGGQGYETNATGFSLAGPRYYAAFKQACVDMIRRYGVNHFKFDGIATGMYASGGAEYIRDTEAMRRLMLELRQEDPHLFINLTTGSWPSPFWLRFADSLWRQGGDMGLAGPGSKQEQWLTYRDQETFRNIVQKSPLYPLNALMTQGVAYSREGSAGEPTFNSAGFKHDVRAFFGSGTCLQELYIQPTRLTANDWQVLAEAAQWSRAHAEVLVDTHWIGGDPSRQEVYGYASWSPRQGAVMLRNPSDQPRDFLLEVGAALELPARAPQIWTLRSPWAEDAAKPALVARVGQAVRLVLEPFQVCVFDAIPEPNKPPTHRAKTRAEATGPASSHPMNLPPQTRPDPPALLPWPARLVWSPGSFVLNQHTTISANASAALEATKLAAELRRSTGLPWARKGRSPGSNRVHLQLDSALQSSLGPEGYRLSIRPDRAAIEAASAAGLYYGGVTLGQLLSPGAPGAGTLPCVEIEDQPRFAWRGLLLDVARHYMPVEFLKKFIDLAALHKINRIQFHLTDDQGWRVEIKKYPKLTELGSVRAESPRKGDRDRGDGTPYGPYFYTQAEIRDLVAYAAARHVTLVPEIEMPGHMLSALTAYPQLSCRQVPLQVRTRWGIEPDVLCPGNDQAIAFALDVLGEIMDLFPGKFIHIGGDEAPRDRWKECPRCQARMKVEGLEREAQLQTYLNRRVESFLAQRGRRLLGWDEILEGGLTPGATVMSWRGVQGGIDAARQGHDVVMSPTTHCYFDYAQGRGPAEPEAIGGFIPLETVYNFEPIPPGLAPAEQRHILGAQGNLWTEYMWTPQDVEYFAFPRAAALAEVVWTPPERRNLADFQRRLQGHLRRLDQLGVNYRRAPLESR